MKLLVLAALAACDSSGGGGSRTATVLVFAGDQPEPGAYVIGHSTNGAVIDQVNADAVGRAEVGVDDGALVSVVFPGEIKATTSVISVVTTPAPESGIELVVHGPKRNTTPPLIVGVLQVDGAPLNTAEYFQVTIGCASVTVARLPANIDVGACSLGSDTKLDVLVAGFHSLNGDPQMPVLDGYAAGTATMVGGVAQLDLPAWRTSGVVVPVSLDGIAPSVSWTLRADGLSFISEQLVGNGVLYANLAIDATTIEASIAGTSAGRITTREVAGTPTRIDFTTTDFLPPLDGSTSIVRRQPLELAWDRATTGADLVNAHLTWDVSVRSTLSIVPPGPHRVVWDAVLPADATGVTLPILDGDLGVAIAPTAAAPVDVLLRFVDSSEHDGFAAVIGAGIHAEDVLQASTIAPRSTNGQLRVTHTVGLAE